MNRLLLTWGLALVASASAIAALPIEKQYSKAETDRIVYIQSAKANLLRDKRNIGKLIVLDYTNREYAERLKAGQPMTFEQLRGLQSKLLGDYAEKASRLESPGASSTRPFDYANLGLDVVAGAVLSVSAPTIAIGRAGALSAKILNEIGRDYYKSRRTVFEDQADTQNQFRRITYDADRILGETYDLGLRHREYREANRATIGLDTIVAPGLSAGDNLELDRAALDSFRIAEIHGRAVDLDERTRAILGATRRLITDLEGSIDPKTGRLTPRAGHLEKRANEIGSLLSVEIETSRLKLIAYLEDKEAKNRRADDERLAGEARLQAMSSSVYLLSGFIGMVDAEAGRTAGIFGGASLEIYQSIARFESVSQVAGLASCVNLAAGIAGGVSTLLSLAIGAPSLGMVTLEQIQALRQQVADLQQKMSERFDEVDRRLNVIFLTMVEGLDKLEGRIGMVSADLQDIRSSLITLREQVQQLDERFYNYLTDGFQQRIAEDREICLSQNPYRTQSEFQACIERFRVYATSHAEGALASGLPRGFHYPDLAQDLDGFYSTIGGELAKGLWNNVNLITATGELLTGRVMRVNGRPVANAEQWAAHANDYFGFVTQNPDFVRALPNLVEKTTNSILSAGAQTEVALLNLGLPGSPIRANGGSNGGANGGPPHVAPSAVSLALDAYESKVSELASALRRERRRFESEGLLSGYDLDKPVEEQQERDGYRIDEILPCPGYQIPEQKRPVILPAPAGLPRSIPAPFRMAQKLGLGRIQVCYDGVEWGSVREEIMVNSGRHYSVDDWRREMDRQQAEYKRGVPKALRSRQIPFESVYRSISPAQVRLHGKIQARIHFTFLFNKPEGKPQSSPQSSIVLSIRRVEEGQSEVAWGIIVLGGQSEWVDSRSHAHRREKYGAPVKWAHGNWPAGMKGHCALEDELRRAWPKIGATLATTSAELLPEKTKSFARKQISGDLEGLLKQKQEELDSRVVPGALLAAGTARTKAQAVDGTKQLLKSLILLAFPRSMETSDELRGLFFGKSPLLDSSLLRKGAGDGGGPDPDRGELFSSTLGKPSRNPSQGEGKVERLRKLLRTLADRNGGQEHHPIIADTERQLVLLKRIHNLLVPQVPLADALTELKAKVRSLALD